MTPTYNVIDLFSGCGGMSLGFKWAGFFTLLATDIDENCHSTYSRNFPNTPFICKDINVISKTEIDEILDNRTVDVIIGGPPCQGFSLANKNRNKVVEDPRNKLFYQYLQFVEWFNPKVFVMENVKGLLSINGGDTIKTIVDLFKKVNNGYIVDYKILRASDYGVPQTRERVVIVGVRSDLNCEPKFPKPNTQVAITVGDAIADLPIIHAGEGSSEMPYISKPQNDYQSLMRQNASYVTNHIAMKHTARIIDRFKAIKAGESLADVADKHGAVKRGNPNEKSNIVFAQNNQRLFSDKPAPTIAASFQSNFIHPTLHRNFTAREGARLQSFPDNYLFEGFRTKMSWEKGLSQYQQIGNAVPPLMAKTIAQTIKSILDNGKTE